MHTNSSWKDWFIFSKKERTVVITALAVFLLYFLFLGFYHPDVTPVVVENLDDKLASLSSEKLSDSNHVSSGRFETGNANEDKQIQKESVLFTFDPNTLDEAGFQRLGLRDKTIHTIVNYRSKGGHFYKPQDLQKIYGLREDEASRLLPYVKIIASQKSADYLQNGKDESATPSAYKKAKPQVIDINAATVEQWKTLPAIGDVLGSRIVKYRDKMGGFSSIEQVKKVYGLSDSAYQVILPYLSFSAGKTNSKIEEKPSSLKKININTAFSKELTSNPAISSDIAEAIVNYRRQHGNYTSVDGIKKIVFINEETFEKISPYLTVE